MSFDAFRVHLRRLTNWRRMLTSAGCCLVFVAFSFAVLVLWPMDAEKYLALDQSPVMLDREDRLMYPFLNSDEQWCFPRGLDAISAHLIHATVAVEDRRFYRHPGVDPLAVARATWQNLRHDRTVSGASTITMQVVKRHDGPARSVWEKCWQMLKAIRLDVQVEKERLLYTYLNSAPYGRNLLGVEAAAQRWFAKPAQELTLTEAALLAGLPQSPSVYDPLRNPRMALLRRDIVLARMLDEGYISGEMYEEAKAEQINAKWHEFPQVAPHWAIKNRSRIIARGELHTTLDIGLQQQVHDALRRHLNRFPREVTNGAVMVVHVPTNEVIVRVGSADFYRTKGGGQVDLCSAPRSPGSTLKPFTYALAMERQKLYPTEFLLDDTLDFGGYNPGNFDKKHNGLVTATEALRFSLNVPAITALQRVEVSDYHSFLQMLHFSTLHNAPEHYGLGITLGNCEIKLEELAAAYAMLANQGVYRPLRLELGSDSVGEKLLSPGIAQAVCGMLRQPFPHDVETGLLRAREHVNPVSWKTGTSTGFHDAWALVFNETWLVAVWMGNNDGRASRQLVGAWAALPLAAELIGGFPNKYMVVNVEKKTITNNKSRIVQICADTGLPVGSACPKPLARSIPSEMFLHRRCAIHGKTWKGEYTEVWPASPHSWDLAKSATPYNMEAPNHSTEFRITSPPHQAKFVFTGEDNGDKILLGTSQDQQWENGTQSSLHWYLNGHYLGASTLGSPFYWKMTPGEHSLACMTETGTSHSVSFSVVLPERGVGLKL